MKRSAGVLAYRFSARGPEVLLVHPGGPFWRNKDDGAWSIPKGEYDDTEEIRAAAKREFLEETGHDIGDKTLIPLSSIKQKSGKRVDAFAVEYDLDETAIVSNLFEVEWPPRSGKLQSFPEADKAGWFSIDEARKKILPAQAALLDQLTEILKQGLLK